jgi:hypothetical protein
VRAALAEEFEVVVADDAAVKHPEAAGFPELRFHRVQDVLQRGAVEPIAGEDFIGEREALGRDDEREHELLAIGPVVARE